MSATAFLPPLVDRCSMNANSDSARWPTMSIPVGMEILTPLHIGSGILLKKDFDFVSTRKGTVIIPQHVLFRYLEQHPEKAQDIANNPGELKYVLDELANRSEEGVLHHGQQVHEEDIHEFMRDAWGQPLIPGSSMKGALRTVIFRDCVKSTQLNIHARLQNDSKDLGKKISKVVLGASPNKDLMRVLSVRDAALTTKHLDLYQCAILSVGQNQQALWKTAGPKNAPNPSEATKITIEALRPGTRWNGTLSYDQFLRNLPLATSGFPSAFPSRMDLPTLLNTHARDFLNKELRFLTALSGLSETYITGLRYLLGRIDTLEPNTALLRVGWGGGWKAMTGDPYSENDLSEIRTKTHSGRPSYRLGKYQGNQPFGIFPKSRRMILRGSDPCWMPGWILIRFENPYSKEELHASTQANEPAPNSSPIHTDTPPSTPPPPLDRMPRNGEIVRAVIVEASAENLRVRLHVVGLENKTFPLTKAKYTLFQPEDTIFVAVGLQKHEIQSVSFSKKLNP